jgi:hypothetical protein
MKAIENLKEAIKTGDTDKALQECSRVEEFIYSTIATAFVLICLFAALALFFAIMSVVIQK